MLLMPEPIISVIMPVYNGERHLHQAVESILRQTFDNFEFLIINDGSTDNTEAILGSFSDERIKLINNGANLGLAASLNKGVDLARGQYIARMDADDVSFPTRFERQLEFLESNPDTDLLGCRAMAFRDSGEIIGLLPFFASHPNICKRPWRGIPLPHPSWMGRTEWFRQFRYGFPEVLRAEDQELLLRAYPYSSFACLSEVLLGYRQGPFNFPKTLVARYHLLNSQLSVFFKRRQWNYFFLSIASSVLKLTLDLIAAFPGFDRLFFWRMSAPVGDSDADKFHKLVDSFSTTH